MRGSHALLEGTWTVDGYRLWLQSANKSEHTLKNYLQWVQRYRDWCREHELDYLAATREHLTYFLGSMAKGHAPTTVYLITLHYVRAHRAQRALSRMAQMDLASRLLGPGEMAG